MQTWLSSDRKCCFCYCMGQLWILYIMIVTCIFKVLIFEKWISWKRWELVKNVQVWLLQRLIFAIEWHHCGCCTPWCWPSFLRSSFSCYAFVINKLYRQQLHPRRFASTHTALAVELLLFYFHYDNCIIYLCWIFIFGIVIFFPSIL